MTTANSTTRFSDRVDAYVAARPGYPPELAPMLMRVFELPADAIVADLGSGTGLSCEPFLRAGLHVIGVEPNAAMRAAGDAYLASYPRFRSVDGRSEVTTLPAASVDLFIAGQAFHWFDVPAARAEALRFLKRPANAAVFWNDRISRGTPFAEGYERLLLDFGTDYVEIRHRHGQEDLVNEFFGHTHVRIAVLPNPTRLDYATLENRLNSASYVPR
ncbi:MAG TPA: class I SAM-dependent methyltransferase, partial [Burkholderiaceae bacterium]|nr:class I SAM-dependent methyltransferase [Burkholderiaceae bacterium]